MSAISKEMRFFSLVKYLTLLKRVQYIYNKFWGGGGGGQITGGWRSEKSDQESTFI